MGYNPELFKKELRKVLVDKHLTQEELATLAGLSSCSISHWCCGQTSPSIKSLMTVCEVLDVTPNDLFGYPS